VSRTGRTGLRHTYVCIRALCTRHGCGREKRRSLTVEHYSSFWFVLKYRCATRVLRLAHVLGAENMVAQTCPRVRTFRAEGAGGTVMSDANLFNPINPPSQQVCLKFGTGPKIPVHGVGTVQVCVTCMKSGEVHLAL
jgi:hypothetical protein